MSNQEERPGCFRRLIKWTVRLAVFLIVLGAVVFGFVFREPIYNRFYYFPKVAAAWEAIRAQYEPVKLDDGWTEFRGVCHSHSELSHDSQVTFPDIIKAAHTADISFICMSDHCVEGKADYSLGLKGIHDGVLFVRGFEMPYGFMPWGLPDDTVLDCGASEESLVKTIEERGGLLFIAHSEEDRHWELPQIAGMEIYNIHTNLKENNASVADLLPDVAFSLRKYPDHVMRTIFRRQTDILKHWDELNRDRKMVGICAGDAHQNNGVYGVYTNDENLQIFEGSGEEMETVKLNGATRGLLRLFCGPLEQGKEVFRLQLDPYERSLRFVNNHVLATDLSEAAILDALRKGRVFVGFDMIADARGFTYYAESGPVKAVMGEEVPMADGIVLHAASPYPVRFTLVHDGNPIETQEGRTFQYPVKEPGKYRIEAEFEIAGEWTPWVYTNPIEVKPSSVAVASATP
ncbi:MAG: hypothetical protein K1Y02_01760 [Candidatus Hydrogenedentes bacterium]|nr:hypothetical protein [Candidatus Hydrogenedentota bacterium]